MAQYSNLDWQTPGLGDVASYQVAAIPFASASITVPANTATPLKIQFPYVTKFVTVVNENTGSNIAMRIGFSQNGISGSSATNYFILDNGESYTGEWRIEDVFLMSNSTSQTSASVIAGLTTIPRGIPTLGASSGNNWSGSSGVG